jgi:hypothetical protein
LSLKNKDILPFETTGMNLKEIVSGKSQWQNTKYCMTTLLSAIHNSQTIEAKIEWWLQGAVEEGKWEVAVWGE